MNLQMQENANTKTTPKNKLTKQTNKQKQITKQIKLTIFFLSNPQSIKCCSASAAYIFVQYHYI